MSRRAKKRFKEYKESNLDFGDVLSLELPNEMRVSGTKRMFESALRSFHALRNFMKVNAHFLDMFPLNKEWRQMAEYHAVLWEVYNLSMNVQTDWSAYISVSYFECLICQIRLFKKEVYNVINMDIESKWQPTVPYINLLIVKCKVVEFTKKVVGNLSEDTNKLIDRLRNELQRYTGTLMTICWLQWY